MDSKLQFIETKEAQTIFYKYVGDSIRRQRKLMRLTQDDFSFVFGISRVSVNNIELGKQRLPLHLLKSISEFLNIKLDELITSYTYGSKTMAELREHKIKLYTDRL